MIRVQFVVHAPEELLGSAAFDSGALIRLERSADEDGPFTEIGTIALDADQRLYTHWDPAGAATSYYRWRISDDGNTTQSGYSDAFQGDELADGALPDTYASLDDVALGYNQDLDDRTKARIRGALVDASQQITDLVGFDFYRHPQSGTEEFYAESSSSGVLHVHDGIVPGSVTKVEVRTTTSSDWDELAVDDYEVEDPEKRGHPSFHVRLTGAGSWSRWPCGRQLVRITGARGWPAVPASVKRATRDRARQLLAWDPTRPGGPVGPEELGGMPGPNRMPDTMFRLQYDYSGWELGLAQCEL